MERVTRHEVELLNVALAVAEASGWPMPASVVVQDGTLTIKLAHVDEVERWAEPSTPVVDYFDDDGRKHRGTLIKRFGVEIGVTAPLMSMVAP